MVTNNRKKPELTSEDTKRVVSCLLLQVESAGDEIKLKRGALSATAKKFDVQPGTVGRLWKRARNNYHDPNIKAFRASPQKKGRSGRKIKWDRDELREEIARLPTAERLMG